jgi:hypothetical protein
VDFTQILIPLLTGASIWALAAKRHKLGFALGLCAQPFWLYSTWTAGLWGIFALSLWCTANYIRGLYNHRGHRGTA